VIANMGAELGATTTVFPADEAGRTFLRSEGRGEDFVAIAAEPGAAYDLTERIDLSQLEPLVAKPSSPGNVVPVREVEGEEVHQVVVGSSANPGLRDFAIVAEIMRGQQSHDQVSFDVNPTSRQLLEDLAAGGWLTAAAAAMTGKLTDPRRLPELRGTGYPALSLPERSHVNTSMLVPPLPPGEALVQELVKGPNIVSLPGFDPLPDRVEAPVELKVGDEVSTDEIMPAGARVLPYRSNVAAISQFVFAGTDEDYPRRAVAGKDTTGHVVVGGDNYGQGSSREHAAIAPRYLGLRVVIAKSFARLHWQNLANFGIVALEFSDPGDYERIEQGDTLAFSRLREELKSGRNVPPAAPTS
ncbi:MAG: aconitase family protein, partial [Acidimicrobiales bacterium]